MRYRALALVGAAALALVVAAAASAHSHISPPVAEPGETQAFTLSVPTEKENATTTKIELLPANGFSIGSIAPAPGWKIAIQKTGTSDEATVNRVTWSGGSIPLGQAAFFQFLGSGKSGTYAFTVRQTYSDGSVVTWSGPESSDTPSPTVKLQSLGGGSNTLGIVGIVVGAIGIVIAAVALLAGRGARELA